jgi:hypothetical protein
MATAEIRAILGTVVHVKIVHPRGEALTENDRAGTVVRGLRIRGGTREILEITGGLKDTEDAVGLDH